MIGFVVMMIFTAVFIGFSFWLPTYLKRHPERRSPSNSSYSGLIGSVDEVFHPEASTAALALDEQQRWVEPAPTPDGDKGIRDRKIRIELS